MSVTLLTDKHFNFVQSGRKILLSLKVPNIVLVLFRMDGDKNCAMFDPIFKSFASRDRRVKCCIMTIGKDSRDFMRNARNTTSPIESVPSLLLFCNSYPKAKIKPFPSPDQLSLNITKVLDQLEEAPSQPQQSFQSSSSRREENKTFMPEGLAQQTIPQGYADDSDESLVMPKGIIPYNTPWESHFSNE